MLGLMPGRRGRDPAADATLWALEAGRLGPAGLGGSSWALPWLAEAVSPPTSHGHPLCLCSHLGTTPGTLGQAHLPTSFGLSCLLKTRLHIRACWERVWISGGPSSPWQGAGGTTATGLFPARFLLGSWRGSAGSHAGGCGHRLEARGGPAPAGTASGPGCLHIPVMRGNPE